MSWIIFFFFLMMYMYSIYICICNIDLWLADRLRDMYKIIIYKEDHKPVHVSGNFQTTNTCRIKNDSSLWSTSSQYGWGAKKWTIGKILGKSDSMKSTLFYKELWVHKSYCETTTILSLPVNFQGIWSMVSFSHKYVHAKTPL